MHGCCIQVNKYVFVRKCRVKKVHEKLDVAETRMWSWMCGATQHDIIRTDRNRGTTKVGEMLKKVQDRGLKWYAVGGTDVDLYNEKRRRMVASLCESVEY